MSTEVEKALTRIENLEKAVSDLTRVAENHATALEKAQATYRSLAERVTGLRVPRAAKELN